MKIDSDIAALAAHAGLQLSYQAQSGETVYAREDSLIAVLNGLDYDVRGRKDAAERLRALKAREARSLPQIIVVRPKERVIAPVPEGFRDEELEWNVELESGETLEGKAGLVTSHLGRSLELPALPEGYHKLCVGAAHAHVFAAPERCHLAETLQGEGRAWGATAQIYGLRAHDDLGTGVLSDAMQFARALGESGAAFLALSPLHAMFPEDRTKYSPYSPSSRLFIDPFYIDPRSASFAGEHLGKALASSDVEHTLPHLRQQTLIDYEATWALRRELLDALWADFHGEGRFDDFDTYVSAGGEHLRLHALFHALAEQFSREGRPSIADWPAEFQDARSPAVAAAARVNPKSVQFHAWLQWLADTQLRSAADAARSAGMNIGLCRDLAVGPSPAGSEVWTDRDEFALKLSIGAPPDALCPYGQNWRSPPLHPKRVQRNGTAHFRRIVSANMRHAGALRIDHSLQLERLFLIPEGADCSDGVYVRYPFPALMAALRIESNRARCMVISDDTGTVNQDFAAKMMENGLLSTRLLTSERDVDGNFKVPEDFPRNAIASFGAHDLPTFAGWWRGFDIDLRTCLGAEDHATAQSQQVARQADRIRIGGNGSVCDICEPPYLAMFEHLARTRSMLVAIQVEDLARDAHHASLRGSPLDYPNWRRRVPVTIGQITQAGSLMAKTSVLMAQAGRSMQSSLHLATPAPRATYRIQFHAGFTFDDAANIAPYLARLGVTHIYASPIQAAQPGSSHGYDIIDHARINPELGGDLGFRRFSQTLQQYGLRLLLDIVPNHMGVGGSENQWWLSTLEWGRLSPHERSFDIDWDRGGAHQKLVLPFLDRPYGEALFNGELQLRFCHVDGSFAVWHREHKFPINPLDYAGILELANASMDNPRGMRDILRIAEELRELSSAALPVAPETRVERCERIKRDIASMARGNTDISFALKSAINYINGSQDARASYNILHRLLARQCYRLAYWRVATSETNYRRFFDINSLAGLRMEEPLTFQRTHELIFQLADEGLVHGLRIDHVDGLADPLQYLERLQDRLGPGFYIVVEKIVEQGEKLRNWPIAGGTGYECMASLDGVLMAAKNEDAFTSAYAEFAGQRPDFSTQVRASKLELLRKSFGSELDSLVSDFKRVADEVVTTSDLTANDLRTATAEIIAALPVYRTYLDNSAPSRIDTDLLQSAVTEALETTSLETKRTHDFIKSLLIGGPHPEHSCAHHPLRGRIVQRFQQLTGPVMAKSVEDTLFYRDVRSVALNEVGGAPDHFGSSLEQFHAMNAERARAWPAQLVPTATHDMKRGEDVRARLIALSHVPDVWGKIVEAANKVFIQHKPDANDRYMLLQTLIGALPERFHETPPQDPYFEERLCAYATKALRESKRLTSWTSPNEIYEQTAHLWLRSLLRGEQFLAALAQEFPALARAGNACSLIRTVLKLTVPGVPDIYQGCEFADFSLVDPDNRRPVDYQCRRKTLELGDGTSFDAIKQRLIRCLLLDRAEAPALYARGEYHPLEAPEPGLIAFARRYGRSELRVVASQDPWSSPPSVYRELLPTAKGPWRNLLHDNAFAAGGAGRTKILATVFRNSC